MISSILFVAPFKSMAQRARRVMHKMQVDFPIVIGNDEVGAAQVYKYPEAKILISRGGTTKELMRCYPDKTVVDIPASFTDISKAIEFLIAKGCIKIAVITHENIIGLAASTLKFGKLNVEVIPCVSAAAIELAVNECIARGADGIAGCVIAVRAAQAQGVKSCFIDAAAESIISSITLALTFNAGFSQREQAVEQLRSLIDALEEGIVIFDKEHHPIYFNENARHIFDQLPPEQWHTPLDRYLNDTHRHPHVINLGDRQVVLHTAKLSQDSGQIVAILQEGRFIEQSEKAMRVANYAKGFYAKVSFDDLTFVDKDMQEVVALALKFARSDSTILLFGETGSGKEGFAQSIHQASRRSTMPFVSVNCASLPEGLIASELFGYVEGAFTGARQSGKKGLFELAQGGTIFLDEITELPLEVQSQLLRVLQEREVMRVGDDKVIPLDIRVICACNKSLLQLCQMGKFRYDLYYRINVLKLKIPALRQRQDDILPLFTRFVSEKLKLSPKDITIDDSAAALLKAYTWPGNVRELSNVAEVCSFAGPHIGRATVLQCLQNDDPNVSNFNTNSPLGMTLHLPPQASAEQVLQLYLRELAKNHSNNEMVSISGLSRTTIWRKLNALTGTEEKLKG